MKKVLIITYYWPPSGGAGVQRWLKFSKYLPLYGWEPFILTVDPRYASYPALDPSLERDVPEVTRVYRTRATDWFRLYGSDKSKVPSGGFATNRDDSLRGKISRFVRGNFFIPDPRRGWNHHALRKACRLIEDEDITSIVTTSPPHSTQLTGLALKRRYPSIKWIADLRDPWTDIYYYDLFYPTFFSKALDRHYERTVLEKADIITTVGPALGRHFEDKISLQAKKIRLIQNGYDEADFEDVTSLSPDMFTISYTGTISDSYPLDGFLTAVRNLIDTGNDIRIRFTGHISDVHKERFIELPGKEPAEFLPYSDHSTVIRQMMSASVLLLVLAKDPGNRSFLPGKLFEYIATGKPVLALGPVDGDTAEILEKGGFGRCFDYDDSAGMTEFLVNIMTGSFTVTGMLPEEFSRRRLTSKIADLLEHEGSN